MIKKAIVSLVFVYAYMFSFGCSRTAMTPAGVTEADSPADTAPQTSVATGTDTGTVTATADDTGTKTQTQTVPATVVGTHTDSSTATKTETSVTPFKILGVTIDEVDALGKPAEDVRSFGVRFSGPARDVDWTVIRTKDGADDGIFFHGYLATAPASLYISPGDWPNKLESDVSYRWVIKASKDFAAEDDLDGSDRSTGEFKTAYCFIGEYKYFYTDAARGTDNVGRCHGAMMECVWNGYGPSLTGAGELTPYPWGDICGNGIDDDCDGSVDNSPTIEIPAGQDTMWSKEGTDGEVLRFIIKAGNASKRLVSFLRVDVESKGVNLGYYHLWRMTDGRWQEIKNVFFFDASDGPAQEGKADLGQGFYFGTSSAYTLGMRLPDYGLSLETDGEISLMLVALADIQSKLSGTSVKVSNPRSESSCPAIGSTTITIE